MDVTAALIPGIGEEFSLETVTLDGPAPNEVVVKIVGVGLCHTDLAVGAGHIPFPFPAVLGHEGSGVVAEIGSAVESVAVGDKVALSFNSCGECTHCQKNEPAYCHNFMGFNFAGARPDGSPAMKSADREVGHNFFGQSSLATYALANERNVVRLPDDAPVEIVGPLGCGIQTGAGAVMNSLDVKPGSSLLVVGAGSVGLSSVLAGVVRDASPLIVVEPHSERRELALSLGATHVIDPGAGPLAEQVRGIVPEGVDYAVDTTAIVGVLDEVIQSLAVRGMLGLVGVPADPTAALKLPLIQSQGLGLTVRGIVEGDSDPKTFIPYLLKLHREGRFPFDKLVTTVPFVDINEAVKLQATGGAVKVVLLHS